MRIVVAGAGYGGVRVAQELGRRIRAAGAGAKHELVLVSQSPFHVIKTELHTIAGGTAEDPGDVQVPLEELFSGLHVALLHRKIEGVRPERNRLLLDDGGELEYDRLVLALGASPEYFGIPGLAEHSLALSDVESALAIRRRVDDVERRAAATGCSQPARIVVGGGGLTGVELAGELAWALRRKFARSGPSRVASVTLIEAAPHLMPGLDSRLGAWAQARLERLGVEVRTGAQIAEVRSVDIALRRPGSDGDANEGDPDAGDGDASEVVPYDLLVWSGGVRGTRLLESVFETDRRGRVVVGARFEVEKYPNVRVLGDAACVKDSRGRPVAPTAQAAVQQAVWVAASLWSELTGSAGRGEAPAHAPYTGANKGILASVGPDYGIGLLGDVPVRGRWVKWLKDANNVRYLASVGVAWKRRRLPEVAERAAGAGYEA